LISLLGTGSCGLSLQGHESSNHNRTHGELIEIKSTAGKPGFPHHYGWIPSADPGAPQPWAGWTGAICYTLLEFAPPAGGEHERKPERLKPERLIRARRTSTLSRRIDAA
jgi:hypothetical protein